MWVFVHDLTGTHRDSYFLSTDPTMTVARVIETYTGSWSIETTFKRCGRTWAWRRRGVGRAEHGLTGGAVPVRLVLGGGAAVRRAAVEKTAEGAVSWGKSEVTFSDAISVVRRRLWLEGVFESHGQTEVFENLPRMLRAVLLTALAPAA